MYYDLHIHTTDSDGDLSSVDLLKRANDKGLEYLCITDHDYISNKNIEKEYEKLTGEKTKTKLLTGIEFTIDERKSMHILGYRIKNLKIVRELLLKQQYENLMICKRLLEHLKKDYQFDIDLEKYKECKMSKGLIRRMLVEGGYSSSLDEAGDLYTGKKSKYYEKTRALNIEKVFDIIKKSGGIPVLAHPSTLKLSDEDLDKEILFLKEFGLEGIEVLNLSKTTKRQAEYFESLAKKYDLLTSCGSDFHSDLSTPYFGVNNEKSKMLIKKIMEG